MAERGIMELQLTHQGHDVVRLLRDVVYEVIATDTEWPHCKGHWERDIDWLILETAKVARDGRVIRASGGVECNVCNKTFRNHPMLVIPHASLDGWTLHVVCGGRLMHL